MFSPRFHFQSVLEIVIIHEIPQSLNKLLIKTTTEFNSVLMMALQLIGRRSNLLYSSHLCFFNDSKRDFMCRHNDAVKVN